MADSNSTDDSFPSDTITIKDIPNTFTCENISVSWSFDLSGNLTSAQDIVDIYLFGYTDEGEDPSAPADDVDELSEPLLQTTISDSPHRVRLQDLTL